MSLIFDAFRTALPTVRVVGRASAFARLRRHFAADRTTLAMAGTVIVSLLIAISDVFSKLLTKSLPAIEVAWLRYAVFALFVLPLARGGVREAFRTVRPRVQMTRGIAGGLATAFAITGFAFLPVAEATAIGFVAPVFVTALAVVVLRETVGFRRWAAALVGLAGVMIIVQPGTASFRAASLLPLAAAFASASAIVATRTMRHERARTTLLYTAIAGTVVLTPAGLWHWVMPNWTEVAFAVLAGVFATASNLMQIYCYRWAAASSIAPFTYTQLIWASLLGTLVFAYVPGLNVLLGAAVIAASGIYTARRERSHRRATLAAHASKPVTVS